jgi:hypothetical protein
MNATVRSMTNFHQPLICGLQTWVCTGGWRTFIKRVGWLAIFIASYYAVTHGSRGRFDHLQNPKKTSVISLISDRVKLEVQHKVGVHVNSVLGS